MLKDIFGQAWEAMVYNRRRTTITMVGMAWGIATVVLLLAYGAGFSRAIEAIFAQWGTNIIGFFPGRTSEQAGGDKAGVRVRFTLDDVERAENNIPSIFHISPVVFKDVPVQNDLHTYTWSVNGVRSAFQDIWKLDTESGRFFNGAEDQQRAHVCVIGSEAKTKLFSGGWALGENIRLNGVLFTVVGVLNPKMQEGDDDDRNRQIYVPFNTMRPERYQVPRRNLVQLSRRQRTGREKSARFHGSGASFPSLRPQRHLRCQPHDPTAPVQNTVDSPAGFAVDGRGLDAGHRWYRLDEYHAGRGTAAHPRNWR